MSANITLLQPIYINNGTIAYKSPESEILSENIDTKEFYVVGEKKAVVLFVGTLGLYTVYWFYQHWAQYKQKHGESLWAPMRAIFFIFFTYNLFLEFERAAREKVKDFTFHPGVLALALIITTVVERVASRYSPEDEFIPLIDLLGFIFMPLQAWVIFKAQIAANLACDAVGGEGNTHYTAANIIWLILGGLLWAIVLAGFWALYAGY